jgi:hypothetical protein
MPGVTDVTEVVVRRGDHTRSTWYAAKLRIELELDRAGLDGPYQWVEGEAELRYSASRPMCDAVAQAIAELGLTIEVAD